MSEETEEPEGTLSEELGDISKEDIEKFLGKPAEQEKKPEAKKVEIPKDPLIDIDSPSFSNTVQSMFNIHEASEVTSLDKERFLRCVLEDVPFELEIVSHTGMKFKFKARKTFEQELIIKCLESTTTLTNMHLATSFSTAQRYIAITSLLEVNGDEFPIVNLQDFKKSTIPKTRKALDAAVEEHLDWSELKWSLCLQALTIFENKKQKLLQESFNENFWEHED